MISDLHLAPDGRSRCTTEPGRVIELIERLEDVCDEVVVVGDAMDLLRPRRLRGWRAEMGRLKEQEPGLMSALSRCRLLVGNHDHPLRAIGVPEERSYVSQRVKLLCVHGHQWDVWLKKVWGMEEGANFVAGWLERLHLDGVSRWMGDVPEATQRLTARLFSMGGGDGGQAPREDECSATWQGVREEFERGFDVIAIGHTHGLGLWPLDGAPGKLVINTGSHVHGWRDAVVCDLEEELVWSLRDERVIQVAWRTGDAWRTGERGEDRFEAIQGALRW